MTRTFGCVEVYQAETFECLAAGFDGFGHVLDPVANQLVRLVAGVHLQLDVVVADTSRGQAGGCFRLKTLDQVEPSGDVSKDVGGRARVQPQFLRFVERHLQAKST